MTLSRMCLCLFLWMAAAVVPSFQTALKTLYPKINSSETLSCECPDHSCQEVFWYRYHENTQTMEYIMYVNNAGKLVPAKKFDNSRFKGSAGQRSTYTLRIMELQEDDAGFYSCMFKTKNHMQAGYYLNPGVILPTVAPPTDKPRRPWRSSCNCKPISPKGCENLVLWPGIGALLLLAIILAGTLYYFSRLPKKCRHRFAKTTPLR